MVYLTMLLGGLVFGVVFHFILHVSVFKSCCSICGDFAGDFSEKGVLRNFETWDHPYTIDSSLFVKLFESSLNLEERI